MKQKERDKLLEKEPFFTSNIPISIWKDDKNDKFYPVCVMPRKEACFTGEVFKTEEEFQEYCDMAIATYENAVELFKLLKEKKINYIYMFNSPKKYLKENQDEFQQMVSEKLEQIEEKKNENSGNR